MINLQCRIFTSEIDIIEWDWNKFQPHLFINNCYNSCTSVSIWVSPFPKKFKVSNTCAFSLTPCAAFSVITNLRMELFEALELVLGAGVLMLVHAASQLLIVVEENYLYWCFVWAENAQELRNGTNTRFILFCSRVSSIGVPQNNLILWNVLEIFCIFSHILQASQKALLVYCTFLV